MDILDQEKYKVFKVFKWLKSKVERQNGHKFKTLRTNGGGEYVSNYFGKYCDQEGVVH